MSALLSPVFETYNLHKFLLSINILTQVLPLNFRFKLLILFLVNNLLFVNK